MMKSVLLGVTVSAFAFSSALAGGCFGSHQKMAMSEKAKPAEVAQSKPEKLPDLSGKEFAHLKDGWLVKYL